MSHIALRKNQTFEKPLIFNEDEQDDIVQTKLDRVAPGRINLRNVLKDELTNDRTAIRQAYSDAVDQIDDLRGFIFQKFTQATRLDLQAPEREVTLVRPNHDVEQQPQRDNEPAQQQAIEPAPEQIAEPAPEPAQEEVAEPVPELIQEQVAEPVPEPVQEVAQQPAAPEPDQVSEEPLPENMLHLDPFADNPNKNHQKLAQSSSQGFQGSSRLLSTYVSQQQSQHSGQSQATQKTDNDLSMAIAGSAKGKGTQTSSSAHPFSQVNSSSTTLTYMQGQSAHIKGANNPSTALTQNPSAREGNSAKGLAQGMSSMLQGQMDDAQKTQALRNNQQRQMTQKNGNGFSMHPTVGHSGNAAGRSSLMLSSAPNERLPPSESSDKASTLRMSNDKSGKAVSTPPITREPAHEKMTSATASASPLAQAAATGVQQSHPQELLSIANPMPMSPPIHSQPTPTLSIPSSSLQIPLSSTNPALRAQIGAQDKAVFKDIKVMAGAPAPVLLSNSSAMNTVTTEKNEEEEESEENTPLIRAVVFGSDQIIDAEMQDLIRTLKDNKVKLALLSQQKEHPLFDLCLQSSKIFAKPDWTAYKEEIALPAEEILFIDTDTARVQDAKIMGLNTITFSSLKKLKEELIKKKLI